MIAVSCGIKIFAVRCLVLSQYTHLTDRQTDGQTDGQNCDSNTVRCIICSRTVKIDQPAPAKVYKHDGQSGLQSVEGRMYNCRCSRYSPLESPARFTQSTTAHSIHATGDYSENRMSYSFIHSL